MIFLHRTNTRTATRTLLGALLGAMVLGGCQAPPRNHAAINAYYRYDYPTARDALREDATMRNDEQVLLNNARLGMAALADGDLHEAERSLGYAFDLLSTAGLNADRTTAAILSHEGVRIWKGEPFEQAMMYYYVSALYAVLGDWENSRAAASNALFRLTDFGEYESPRELAKQAATDDDFLDTAYTAVETDFALGFVMQAIAADLSGAPGSDDMFDAAVSIDPALSPLVQTLRSGEYNTLLLVDYGKGPTKIAYGPDNALVRFEQQEPPAVAESPLIVAEGGYEVTHAVPIANISAMAADHRWNNLEDIRRAKSAIGDALLTGGLIATSIGAEHRSLEAALGGVGAMLLGGLSKSGAQADTRYLEFLPQSVYIVPLWLEDVADVQLSVNDDAYLLTGVEPGTASSPAAMYVRMLGPGSTPAARREDQSPILPHVREE